MISNYAYKLGWMQDSLPYQVFIDVFGAHRHGRVHYRPSTITPSNYFDTLHTGDLRWGVEIATGCPCYKREVVE